MSVPRGSEHPSQSGLSPGVHGRGTSDPWEYPVRGPAPVRQWRGYGIRPCLQVCPSISLLLVFDVIVVIDVVIVVPVVVYKNISVRDVFVTNIIALEI